MNPLTQIRNTQKATLKERDLGLTEGASWHEGFKHSAYVYVGGLDYELTEGDLLAVFAQYGEVVDVNLIKDKSTGKSRGFAFLAYENQKSTILAVDNLSGARVAGRVIRVEHVADYKRKREEDGSDEEAVKTKTLRNDEHPTKHPAAPPRPSVESSETKREMPSESDLPEGSLFDQLNAHLKKKQKSFPPAAEASEGGPHCRRYKRIHK